MRKLGVKEWLVRVLQATYTNARSRVRVNGTLNEEFVGKVGVHQGSVITPLFIMVLEALLHEFTSHRKYNMLMILCCLQSMEELIKKFKKWKGGMETKELWIIAEIVQTRLDRTRGYQQNL